ncbi:MAG: M20/M25/M40 family metallo-hydrolase [Dehalococcoidia bacterium]
MEKCSSLANAINEERLLDTLREMVRVPSPSGQEGEIGEFIGEKCRRWGLDARVKPVGDGRVNTIVRLPGEEPGPTFLFNGHLDTQPLAPGWTLSPYEPFIKDGYLYGSETNNMKAANAAMLEALLILQETNTLKKGNIIVTFVAAECDKQGLGTQHTLQDGIKADWALVGEPTDLNILTAHVNPVQLKITTYGKPAHQFMREQGICAIQKMLKVMNALGDHIITHTPHPDFQKVPRLNIGLIKGGEFASQTAARCEIVADIRAVPGMTVESITQDIQKVLDQLQKEDHEIKTSVEEYNGLPFGSREPYTISKDEPIVQVTKEVCKIVLQREPRVGPLFPHLIYWSDAPFLMQAGIPTVICGPGTVEQMNAPDEHIEVARVIQTAKVYAMVAAELTQR